MLQILLMVAQILANYAACIPVRHSNAFHRGEEYYCDISKGLICNLSAHKVKFGHGIGAHPACVKETMNVTSSRKSNFKIQ